MCAVLDALGVMYRREDALETLRECARAAMIDKRNRDRHAQDDTMYDANECFWIMVL